MVDHSCGHLQLTKNSQPQTPTDAVLKLITATSRGLLATERISFLDQELISYPTHLVLPLHCLVHSLTLRCFKSDRDEIGYEFSLRKYASIDGVGFSI